MSLRLSGGRGRGGGPQGQQSPGTPAGFTRGAVAPAAPAEGHVWSDTAADKLKLYDGAAWLNLATEAFANTGDAATHLAIDNTITSLFRRAQWARAWIRAADAATALAGVAAATWSNQGKGTPPTGAHWDPSQVAAGAGNLYELVSLVSPTAGSTSEWTFGTWAAFEITATNTQYSVDGSTLWHAVRAPADRYERHRQVGGSWGAAIPLYAADELVWTTLLQQTFVHQTIHRLPGFLWELPATINFQNLNLMRIRLLASTTVPVLEGDVIINPDYFVSDRYEDRAVNTLEAAFIWAVRLNGRGLSVVKGDPILGQGPSGDASDTGLALMWHRPSGVSAATEARFLRVLWMRNLRVNHRLTIEAI